MGLQFDSRTMWLSVSVAWVVYSGQCWSEFDEFWDCCHGSPERRDGCFVSYEQYDLCCFVPPPLYVDGIETSANRSVSEGLLYASDSVLVGFNLIDDIFLWHERNSRLSRAQNDSCLEKIMLNPEFAQWSDGAPRPYGNVFPCKAHLGCVVYGCLASTRSTRR